MAESQEKRPWSEMSAQEQDKFKAEMKRIWLNPGTFVGVALVVGAVYLVLQML